MSVSGVSTRGDIPGAVVAPPTARPSSRPSSPNTPRISQHSATSARSCTRSAGSGARRQSPAAALQQAGSTAAAAGRPSTAAARALQGSTAPSEAAGTAASTTQRQRFVRYTLLVLRLVLVGVGGVALWPSVWTYLHLKESFDGKATGAEAFIMFLLVAVCMNILTELIWISFTLWPGLHEAAYRNGWSCGMRRYSLVIISEFVWAGFWLAMIVTMMIMKILWWLTLLTSVLGITLSLACVGLTVWLRVLTEREGETEEEVARVTVAIQTAQQSGKSSAAAGYKYLMQVSANRPGGRAGPAASMV